MRPVLTGNRFLQKLTAYLAVETPTEHRYDLVRWVDWQQVLSTNRQSYITLSSIPCVKKTSGWKWHSENPHANKDTLLFRDYHLQQDDCTRSPE